MEERQLNDGGAAEWEGGSLPFHNDLAYIRQRSCPIALTSSNLKHILERRFAIGVTTGRESR